MVCGGGEESEVKRTVFIFLWALGSFFASASALGLGIAILWKLGAIELGKDHPIGSSADIVPASIGLCVPSLGICGKLPGTEKTN
jgi:hypothetical protein